MGKFCQFLTEVSACHMSVFSSPNDYCSKFQWIFTKLGMFTDLIEIWFGNAMARFCQFLTELSARHTLVFI